VAWDDISRDADRLQGYLDDWVYGVTDRAEYLRRQPDLKARLAAKPAMSGEVSYGY
jgi:hypothetical protein